MRSFGATVMLIALAASAFGATLRDAAIQMQMNRSGYGRAVQILRRAEATPELDMVAVLGTSAKLSGNPIPGNWWDKNRPLGLFLQNRSNPGLIYRITLDRSPDDGNCAARVERITASEVVLSCTPEKGKASPGHKFSYDARAKILTAHAMFDRFQMQAITTMDGKALVVGSDGRSIAAVDYTPGRNPTFSVASQHTANVWARKLLKLTEYTSGGSASPLLYAQPRFVPPPAFGPDKRFRLISNSSPTQPRRFVIRETVGSKARTWDLPQSSYPSFRSLRPSRVRDGYSEASTTIQEEIGAWQIADDTLWFGKSFYDGEGHTGVGGFGWFDTEKHSWQILTPAEVRDWSVTAILIEPSTVWLGLALNGEWGSTPGGLLRYDRTTAEATVFKGPDLIGGIARVGEDLVLATDFGVGVLAQADTSPQWRRYFIDSTGGKLLRIVEAFSRPQAETAVP